MVGSAILLAAGESTRMGCLKGLLPWGEQTLFEHQLQTLVKSPLADLIVVVGYEAKQFINIAQHYPVKIIHNKNYHFGKCSSIIAGLRTVQKSSEMILILAVDQPTESEIIQQLIQSLLKGHHPIAMPLMNEKRGHPILFSTNILKDLLGITEETKGLRNVIAKYENQLVEVPVYNPLIQLNLNSSEDYFAARERLLPFCNIRRP